MHPGPRSPSGAEALREYLRTDWVRWLEQSPELATSVGFPGFNDRWTDDSPAGVEARRRHLHESLSGLKRIDPGPLGVDDRLSYELYLRLLEMAEVGLEYGDDPLPFHSGSPRNLWMPMTQLDGIHIQAPDTLDFQPRSSRAQCDDLLRRLEALPRAVDDTVALMVAGLSKEWTPPRVTIRALPGQVAALMSAEPNSNPFLKPFRDLPRSFDESERTRLWKEAVGHFDREILPSLRRLHEFLLTTYLPGCRESIAASSLPGGLAMYSFRAAAQTTTELSPGEIHEIGLREGRRIRSEMAAIAERAGPPRALPEFLKFLRSDRRFFYDRAEELVDGYRALGKRCDPALARLFGRLPRLPYGIEPVPDYRAASAPAAYYVSGASETGRAGYFYVNTSEVGSRARWEMEALLLHEAVPGHHLQLALAEELSELPEFRRFTGETAFVEGWGLYAESLGEELGFYRDPYSKFGQLLFDAWRSARLVVDTGIHAMGWTREQALDYFRENTGLSEQDTTVEVDRYIVWPGQALAYKVGQLKFRELRSSAERELGDRFDVRAFHDRVLGQGGLPILLLEERVRRWMADERSRARSDGAPA